MRDHGGNLDLAIELYGGSRSDWIDLSTGINPIAYPIGPLDPRESSDLPSSSDLLEPVSYTHLTLPTIHLV